MKIFVPKKYWAVFLFAAVFMFTGFLTSIARVAKTSIAFASVVPIIFSDSFGTGSSAYDIPGWLHGSGTYLQQTGGGNDSASPDDGRFARIAKGEYVCVIIDNRGNESAGLGYYWRGDVNAENPDMGIVEVKRGESCVDSEGWSNVSSEYLTRSSSWTGPVSKPLSSLETKDTKFALRFRNNSSVSDEYFRIDGVSVYALSIITDTDSDGIPNELDNCPNASNPSQIDTDGDGIGDECDNAPNNANPDQNDTDGDTVGDVSDNCPVILNRDQADDDGDGIGNACDPYMCVYSGTEMSGDGIDNDCDGIVDNNILPPNTSNIIFSDDFNDNSLDTAKWIKTTGVSVTEQNGVMNVNRDATDNGGALFSKWIPVNGTQPITVSRRTIQHYSNGYFAGTFRLYFDTNEDGEKDFYFGTDYANNSYNDAGVNRCPRYGIFLVKNSSGWWDGSTACTTQISEAVPAVWNTWITEELAYNPVSGLLSYSIDGVEQKTFNVGALPASSNYSMQLMSDPWGWGTGHYDHFDDIAVIQTPATLQPFTCGISTVKDADGNTYGTTNINGQCWMTENMKVGTMVTGATTQTNNSVTEKYCYNNNSANCTTDGGLYQWDEAIQYSTTEGAQGICPANWHVPTDTEFYKLENYLKDSGAYCNANRLNTGECSGAGTKMKSSTPLGLNFPMAGHRIAEGSFALRGTSGTIWSSSFFGENAWYRYVTSYEPTVYRWKYPKNIGFSVRCIQDSVSANHPPVLTPIGNKTGNKLSELSFTVSATDADSGDVLTYSLTGTVPAGATIDSNTGIFTWTPTESQVGSHTFTVKVSDGKAMDSEAVTVEVTQSAVNQAPIITLSQTDVDWYEGDSFYRGEYATVSDPDGDTIKNFTFSELSSEPDAYPDIYFQRFDAEDEHGKPAEPKILFVHKMRAPVIIVPGILGSELKNSAEQTIFPPNDSRDILGDVLYLEMKSDGTTKNVVTLGDIIRTYPGTNKDIWGDLIQQLTSKGYKEGVDLFVYPYDWRQKIENSASGLASKVTSVLNNTNAKKVDIVAHSMGGLVSKYYIQTNGQNKVRKFIDIGTPHLGTPSAFEQIRWGEDALAPHNAVKAFGIRILAKNAPAAYQLLPSDAYNYKLGSYYYNILDSGFAEGNYATANDYRDLKFYGGANTNGETWNINLHKEIDYHPKSNTYWDGSDFGVKKTVNIIGCGRATLSQITKAKKNNLEYIYRGGYGNGDGTVISRSALALSTDSWDTAYFINNGEHTYLPSNSAQFIVDEITTGYSTALSSDSSKCSLAGGYEVEFHSPIDLNIYDSHGNHTGPTADGGFENNVPGIAYDILGHDKFAFLPDGETYTIKGNATGVGTFDSMITRYENGVPMEERYYSQIPLTTTDTAVTFTIVPDQTDYTMQVDQTGTGTTVTDVEPSSVLDTASEVADMTAPKTTAIVAGIKGTNDWYTSNTIITLSATDDNVGVLKTLYSFNDGTTWQKYIAPIIVSSDGAAAIQYYSIDNAGNYEQPQTVTFKIDATLPMVSLVAPIDGAEYLLRQNVTASWSVSDDGSGILSAEGTMASGSVIDTGTVGEKSYTVTATDNAGNVTTKTVKYRVVYNYGGVLQPVNSDGASIFKFGSTVPVKFQLKDANGTPVTSAIANISVSKVTSTPLGTVVEPETILSATARNQFRYSIDGNQYIFNLSTKPLSTGTWQIRIALDDGTSKTVNFSLK